MLPGNDLKWWETWFWDNLFLFFLLLNLRWAQLYVSLVLLQSDGPNTPNRVFTGVGGGGVQFERNITRVVQVFPFIVKCFFQIHRQGNIWGCVTQTRVYTRAHSAQVASSSEWVNDFLVSNWPWQSHMNIVSDNIHTVLHCLHNSPNSHLSTSNFLTLTLCPISFVLHLSFAVISPLTSVFASCYSSLDSIAISIFAVAVATLLPGFKKSLEKCLMTEWGACQTPPLNMREVQCFHSAIAVLCCEIFTNW